MLLVSHHSVDIFQERLSPSFPIRLLVPVLAERVFVFLVVWLPLLSKMGSELFIGNLLMLHVDPHAHEDLVLAFENPDHT